MAGSKRPAALCDILDLLAATAAGAATCERRRRMWSTDDDFEATRALGGGGSGVVVEARHRHSGEAVAVKSPRRAPAGSRKRQPYAAADELLREAEFLAICGGHPSVVELRALALDPATGEHSLVMERAGPSLHHVLYDRRRGRPLREADVRPVMRQLLRGAEHMHQNCIIHRDIKPGNILVGGDGGGLDAVKICDLGIAVHMAEKRPYRRAGTLGYMAPEVLLGKPDYDTMVDMWSLGCVMAELLAGKPLFRGKDDTLVLLRIFDVLGVPGYRYWPAYDSLPLAGKIVTPPRIPHRNRLREFFPEHRLSEEGFDVLKGLLSCSIDRRLSATAALQRPWFTDAVDDAPVA